MNFTTQLENIINTLTTALEDAQKFDDGIDAAGKRLRASSQDAKNKLQELRLTVQAERNSRKNS